MHCLGLSSLRYWQISPVTSNLRFAMLRIVSCLVQLSTLLKMSCQKILTSFSLLHAVQFQEGPHPLLYQAKSQTNDHSHTEHTNFDPCRHVCSIYRFSTKATRNFYEAILRWLNPPTLNYRRLRGDMIQVYNIVSWKHNNHHTVKLNLSHVSNSRGNIYI